MIAAVVRYILPNELLRFNNFIVEEVRRLLQDPNEGFTLAQLCKFIIQSTHLPLSVIPSMIVAILALGASLTQANLDSPVDCLAA